MPIDTHHNTITKINKKNYRNLVKLALEWENDLNNGIYSLQADVSRKLGVSGARVTQILNLLKLPNNIIHKVEAMRDPLLKR